jgi:hypothetical protein
MAARIIQQTGHELTLQVTVNISGTLLDAEERIQDAVNEVGCLATQEALKQFDTDGSPTCAEQSRSISQGSIKWTARTVSPKKYQTPYGEIEVERHVYQTYKGGASTSPGAKCPHHPPCHAALCQTIEDAACTPGR